MYTPSLASPEIRRRIAVERRIVKATVRALLAAPAGYRLIVDDGEEEHPPTRDRRELYSALMETDEDDLIALDTAGRRVGWVRFVYGNNGWDVVSDYSVNLEDDGTLAPVLALTDQLAGKETA